MFSFGLDVFQGLELSGTGYAGQNVRLEQKVHNKGNVSHELCLHSH